MFDKYDKITCNEAGFFKVENYKGEEIVFDASYFDLKNFMQLLQNHLEFCFESFKEKGDDNQCQFTNETIEQVLFS